MDACHGAEKVVQQVDVVDEVEQDGPAAAGLLATPSLSGGEIGGRFKSGPEAADGGDGAECAGSEHMFGGEDVRVEAAVVPDEEVDAVGVRCGDETGGGGDVGADGLLAQDVSAGLGELGRQGDVGMVGGADDSGVRSVRGGEEGSDGGVEDGGVKGCCVARGGVGVYDGDEGGRGVGRDVVTVSYSYKAAAADDGYS